MTAPVTGITPIYGIEYPIEGEPIRYTRQKLQRSAEQIEAALVTGGVAAPGAADLLAVSGRVSTLEATAAARPLAVLTGTGTLSLPNNTWTTLPLTGSEIFDPLDGHSLVTNTSRWTVPVGAGGWWLAMATARIDTGTGRRGVQVRINGADVLRSQNYNYAESTGGFVFGSNPALFQLVPTDYVEVAAVQDSGSAQTTQLSGASLTLLRVFPS